MFTFAGPGSTARRATRASRTRRRSRSASAKTVSWPIPPHLSKSKPIKELLRNKYSSPQVASLSLRSGVKKQAEICSDRRHDPALRPQEQPHCAASSFRGAEAAEAAVQQKAGAHERGWVTWVDGVLVLACRVRVYFCSSRLTNRITNPSCVCEKWSCTNYHHIESSSLTRLTHSLDYLLPSLVATFRKGVRAIQLVGRASECNQPNATKRCAPPHASLGWGAGVEFCRVLESTNLDRIPLSRVPIQSKHLLYTNTHNSLRCTCTCCCCLPCHGD